MMKLKEILTKGKDQNFYSETEKNLLFFFMTKLIATGSLIDMCHT